MILSSTENVEQSCARFPNTAFHFLNFQRRIAFFAQRWCTKTSVKKHLQYLNRKPACDLYKDLFFAAIPSEEVSKVLKA